MLTSLYGNLGSGVPEVGSAPAKASPSKGFAGGLVSIPAAPKPAAGVGKLNIAQLAADLAASKEALKKKQADKGQPDAAKKGNDDEEYDPARPNDYDALVKERVRKRAEEEMEKRQRLEAEKRQKLLEPPKPPEPVEEDFATKMLKKMGWKEGQGLGKDGQGIAQPLVARKTDVASAVIAQAAPKPRPAGHQFNRDPTKVLLLTNMVGRGEIDEDLEEETKDEAAKYGEITHVKALEIPAVADHEAVRIFLQFSRSDSATKAFLGINGRNFGGRVVTARFYSEACFAQGNLTADASHP